MNCRDLDALLESGKPLPETGERHLSTCPACRRLLKALDSAQSAPSTIPVKSILPVNLLEDLKPVRPLPRDPLLVLPAILSAALVCLAGIAGWGVAGWNAQSIIERLILFGTIGAALFASAYSLSLEMVPGSKPRFDWRWPESSAYAAFIVTVAIAFHRVYRFDMRAIHGECFGRGLLAAAAVLPLLFLAVRRGVFLDRKNAAASIAVLIASAALLILTVYCPILNWQHVLIAHLGAVAVIVAAAIIVGRLSD